MSSSFAMLVLIAMAAAVCSAAGDEWDEVCDIRLDGLPFAAQHEVCGKCLLLSKGARVVGRFILDFDWPRSSPWNGKSLLLQLIRFESASASKPNCRRCVPVEWGW
jgi:hypothetical protein